MSGDLCVCGHTRYDHIYEESACRPGFVCEEACTRFRLDDGQFTIDDVLGHLIPSRTSDPDTSRVAEQVVKVKAGTQRARLLEAFHLTWEDGLTDEQAMKAAPGVPATSEYAKRCSELREGGFIEPTGETRLGAAGTPRIVSRITPKGAAWIKENQ